MKTDNIKVCCKTNLYVKLLKRIYFWKSFFIYFLVLVISIFMSSFAFFWRMWGVRRVEKQYLNYSFCIRHDTKREKLKTFMSDNKNLWDDK